MEGATATMKPVVLRSPRVFNRSLTPEGSNPRPEDSRGRTHFISLTPEDSRGRTHFISLTPEDSRGRTHFISLTPEDSRGRTHFISLLMTMLTRPGNGRNFCGIDSHVFLPIITAFCLPTQSQNMHQHKFHNAAIS